MYLLSWIAVGLISGWLTGQLLAGGGYGPIMEMCPIANRFAGSTGIVEENTGVRQS
jgi:uncharacterized membrane protein YeaQ/YmgE (transglycosylase-associated protein family)